MLLAMGKVEAADVDEVLRMFDDLDPKRTGIIRVRDVSHTLVPSFTMRAMEVRAASKVDASSLLSQQLGQSALSAPLLQTGNAHTPA